MVLADKVRKRHPSRCLFFVGISSTALALMGLTGHVEAGDCLTGAPAQRVHVAQVTDGDSLVLGDGRRLRLIGVNTLELHTPAKADRQLAEQASHTLRSLLAGQHASMVPGIDMQDSHGRLLAHLRLTDGRDAAHILVDQGLALAVAVGNNTRCADSLASVEKRARETRRGVWQSPGPWFIGETLTGREHGFHVITGTVLNVTGRGARTTWHLANGLHVIRGRHWPRDADLHTDVPDRPTGSKVEVRGWLETSSGRQRLTLHHPANLKLISN